VEQGIDIAAQRRAARSVPTFGNVADRFLSEHVANNRKGRTHESYGTLMPAQGVLPGNDSGTSPRSIPVKRLQSSAVRCRTVPPFRLGIIRRRDPRYRQFACNAMRQPEGGYPIGVAGPDRGQECELTSCEQNSAR
jgi:hypothetical protein